ncbi:MAG: hypothetical protein LM566_05680 [Pyrobaculum sp.]|nr:hypothetical protein [Pyrobaculum sp.]
MIFRLRSKLHVTWRRYGRRAGLALRSRTLLLKEVLERLKLLLEVAEVLGLLEAERLGA